MAKIQGTRSKLKMPCTPLWGRLSLPRDAVPFVIQKYNMNVLVEHKKLRQCQELLDDQKTEGQDGF